MAQSINIGEFILSNKPDPFGISITSKGKKSCIRVYESMKEKPTPVMYHVETYFNGLRDIRFYKSEKNQFYLVVMSNLGDCINYDIYDERYR